MVAYSNWRDLDLIDLTNSTSETRLPKTEESNLLANQKQTNPGVGSYVSRYAGRQVLFVL